MKIILGLNACHADTSACIIKDKDLVLNKMGQERFKGIEGFKT